MTGDQPVLIVVGDSITAGVCDRLTPTGWRTFDIGTLGGLFTGMDINVASSNYARTLTVETLRRIEPLDDGPSLKAMRPSVRARHQFDRTPTSPKRRR